MSAPRYNLSNPAVKRILQEVKEMQSNPSDDYLSLPLEDNIFEWQFAIRGPQDSEFEGGIYHGRIQLPPEYPFKPPAFMLLTPNGRFETQTKICLSISQYHPEHWQPSWSVRTALVALIAFFPTKANGAIGSLEFSKEERRALALKSIEAAPKYGNEERQKVIDEIHEQMIKKAHPLEISHATTLNSAPDRERDELSSSQTGKLDHNDAVTISQAICPNVPISETGNVEAPHSEPRAVVEPPIMRPTTRQAASDDQILTLLAIGLVVALAALLMRKLFNSCGGIHF